MSTGPNVLAHEALSPSSTHPYSMNLAEIHDAGTTPVTPTRSFSTYHSRISVMTDYSLQEMQQVDPERNVQRDRVLVHVGRPIPGGERLTKPAP